MPNIISQDQNTPKQLERLAAQRYLYSRAKRLLTGQLFLDLVSPIMLAMIVALFPNFGIYAALIAFIILVSDFSLESLQSSKREQAAGVQELFDCELLDLQCHDLIARNIPDTVEIMEAAEKYKRSDPTYQALKDWYSPEVDALPCTWRDSSAREAIVYGTFSYGRNICDGLGQSSLFSVFS